MLTAPSAPSRPPRRGPGARPESPAKSVGKSSSTTMASTFAPAKAFCPVKAARPLATVASAPWRSKNAGSERSPAKTRMASPGAPDVAPTTALPVAPWGPGARHRRRRAASIEVCRTTSSAAPPSESGWIASTPSGRGTRTRPRRRTSTRRTRRAWTAIARTTLLGSSGLVNANTSVMSACGSAGRPRGHRGDP